MALVSCIWIALGSLAAAAATSGDWAQAQGSALHAGAVSTAPEPPYQEAWSVAVAPGGPDHQFGLSAPVIAGNSVVTVAPEQVMGFDLTSGTPTFTVDKELGPSVPPALATVGGHTAVVYTEGFGTEPPSGLPTSPSPATAGASTPPSPSTSASASSTATPSGGGSSTSIAALSTQSRLAAFDLKTHKPLWPPIPLDQASRTGVTVDGGIAYVGDDLGRVYAIDLARGSITWRGAVGDSPEAPLVVTSDLVIVTVPGNAQNRARVVALKVTDGTQAWSYDGGTLGAVISGASVSGDSVYAAFADNTLRALNLSDGSLRWRGHLSSVLSPTESPAISGDAVYSIDVLGELRRSDPATGARVWDFAMNELVLRGSPVVAGDHVLVATGRGRLAAIDPVSGHLVWESDATGSLLRSVTPTSNLILAVRGGPQAGLVAYRHDDAGTLLDIVSPTVFNAGTFARNFAGAALPFLLVAILLGRFLAQRMGPAFIIEDDGTAVAEPIDPWDTDEGGPR